MSDRRASSVETVVRRIERHTFAPVHNGFTVDPKTGNDGVEDLQNDDWRVRTLAVRDLVRRGREGPGHVRGLLHHDDEHVRQVAALVLGLLRAESAVGALSRRLRDDPDPVVRSQAAIALGQIGAPTFTLNDTEGTPWSLADALGKTTVVLLWVFSDWCPVCHKEFRGLIDREEQFRELDVTVATLECHDQYRCRVMEGKEFRPSYWFADKLPDGHPHDAYPDEIWWPHLVDRAAAVGLPYGINPWQYAVHSEYVNRPATVIIDSEGTVRLAHFGTYWGDRPTIGQILDMIETGTYEFEAPPRAALTRASALHISTVPLYEQHAASSPVLCTGGQGTRPYEQKTQQSPDFARTVAPHEGQSQKNRQLRSGISAVVWASQWGHVIVDVN